MPRDVTIVVDISGSMSGDKIVQARAALNALLGSLSAGDRFRLIAFSDQVRAYRNGWLPANATALEPARDWISTLRAEGGTNISGALEEAFAATSPESRLAFVIFITDGLPSVGESNPERIANRAENQRGRARVFAFGVGYDVNTYLLDRLTAAARGSTQYVRPGETVERPLATLAAKIRFPVLTDLRIGDAPVRIEEVYPVDLPDLYADEELTIIGRYRGAGRGGISINGRRSGNAQSFSTTAEFPDHELDNDYIPKIWAARKVGFLTQRIKLHGQDRETLEQLRETAMRYGILSEYTSYLVQEPEMQVVAQSRGRVGRTAAAPPAIAATGQGAVESSMAARKQRDVKTANEVDAMSVADEAHGTAGRRVVGGRVFRQESGSWVDAGKAPAKVLAIKPFSPAYFAMLRALPELEVYWKVFTAVQVNGKHLSVRLAAGGVSEITAAQIADAVKEFRN